MEIASLHVCNFPCDKCTLGYRRCQNNTASAIGLSSGVLKCHITYFEDFSRTKITKDLNYTRNKIILILRTTLCPEISNPLDIEMSNLNNSE